LKEIVLEKREELLEAIAEYDETLMEKFFEDPDSISAEEMRAAIRAAVRRYEHHAGILWFSLSKTKAYRPYWMVYVHSCLLHWISKQSKEQTRIQKSQKSVSQV
jgi:translation elongation factor EF-G